MSVGHLCILHSLFLVSVGQPMYSTQPVFGVCTTSMYSTQSVFGVCRTPMYSTQAVFGVCRAAYVFYTACFWCL